MPMSVLSFAIAAELLVPIGQFGWRPVGAAQGELFLPGPTSLQLERREREEAVSCPEGQRTGESVQVSGTALGPGSGFSIEIRTCVSDGYLSGTLFLRLRPEGEGRSAGVNWTALLSTSEARMGFADPPRQPAVARLTEPGFAIVQFQERTTDNGGSTESFSQLLLDLRGEQPRALATGVWTMGGGRIACSGVQPDDSGYSCSWDDGRSDFACVEKEAEAQRSFGLTSAEPLTQDLGPTVPIERATAGQMVRVPEFGLARMVANLSPSLKLAVFNQGQLLLEKSGNSWKARGRPAQSRQRKGMEVNRVQPIKVVALRTTPEERIFDVLQEGVQTLIRYGPGVGLSSLRVAAAAPVLDVCGARHGYSSDMEILTLRSRSTGVEVLFQDPFDFGAFEQRRFDESGEADEKAETRCPRVGVLTWDIAEPIRELEGAAPCERPMRPLLAAPRSGRLDLLWGNGVTNLSDLSGDFSFRGQGQGTIVLLDSALPSGAWEQLAVTLPNDIEVLRVPVYSFADPLAAIKDAAAAIRDVSARSIAVVAIGWPTPELIEALPSLPLRPVRTLAIYPTAAQSTGPNASAVRVSSIKDADLAAWTQRGFGIRRLTSLQGKDLAPEIRKLAGDLGWTTSSR